MKLQQLRYVIQVAESGSLTAAAEKLFIAQPSLSKAVSELEREMDITIFTRSRTGVVPTEEGMRFLSRARQVIEQADLLESEYKGTDRIRRVFGISTQHYAFVVNAFVSLVREYDRNRYEFSLRETSTAGIIDDVRVQRSELGVLYRCDFNESVISNVVKSADLHFVPLFRAKPHVFVSRNSPLARLERATLADLAPYPRLSYDQGIRNSLYYAEELHIAEAVDKSIVVTDRATLFNLIIGLDGYTISSGILSEDLNGSQIVSIPLESPEHMELGYVKRADRPLSSVAERYLQLLQEYVNEYQREAGESGRPPPRASPSTREASTLPRERRRQRTSRHEEGRPPAPDTARRPRSPPTYPFLLAIHIPTKPIVFYRAGLWHPFPRNTSDERTQPMAITNPPYAYDIVGSFLRPEAL